MRKAAAVCRGILWALLIVVFGLQILTIVSIQMNNQTAIQMDQAEKVYSVVPLMLACGLMLVGAFLFGFYKKRRYIGLILCVAAGVIFIVTALEIHRVFPASIGVDGKIKGITEARMVLRHMTPAAIPLLMLPAWLLERTAERKTPPDFTEKEHFDLSGEPVFREERDRAPLKKEPPSAAKKGRRNRY